MTLEGKVVAVTGGTRGLGWGISLALFRAGANLALNSRSPAHGKEALENLGAPHRSLFVAGDVRQKADVEGFIDATIRRFGHIDVLVNNAGGAVATELVDQTTDATWHDTIAWNLSSAFWATRRALPSMLQRQWGRIINISGVLGKKGSGSVWRRT